MDTAPWPARAAHVAVALPDGARAQVVLGSSLETARNRMGCLKKIGKEGLRGLKEARCPWRSEHQHIMWLSA